MQTIPLAIFMFLHVLIVCTKKNRLQRRPAYRHPQKRKKEDPIFQQRPKVLLDGVDATNGLRAA